jgi:hypothetical protein
MSSITTLETARQPGTGQARYIMIGGFLGAGKTTAAGKLAQHLSGRGLRVGLVTNDQGRNLADTTMLRSQGFATEEIPGGCFCCRFNSLVEAVQRLRHQSQPEVFIAAPVRSCTDLVATVAYPLRRLYGGNFTVAAIGLTVTLLISLVGPLTMACFNPARDFGPRVFSALAGWGNVPFQVNGAGWWAVYLVAPLLGGLVGGGIYSVCFKRACAADG